LEIEKMRSLTEIDRCTGTDIKERQSIKIRSIGRTLIEAGFKTLDDQARVLRLPRSTAWTMLKSTHKASGLTAATINRMLNSPTLPLVTRAKIIEYIKEKTEGFYGHSAAQLRKFNAHIVADVFCDRLMENSNQPNHSRGADLGLRGQRTARLVRGR
jgi:hypothetical protein